MRTNIAQGWATTGVGLYAGVQGFEDGIDRLSQNTGDVVGWLQLVAALLAVIVGALSPNPGKAR